MIGLTYTWHPAEDIVQQLETFPEADDKVEAPGLNLGDPWSLHQGIPRVVQMMIEGHLPGPFTHEIYSR